MGMDTSAAPETVRFSDGIRPSCMDGCTAAVSRIFYRTLSKLKEMSLPSCRRKTIFFVISLWRPLAFWPFFFWFFRPPGIFVRRKEPGAGIPVRGRTHPETVHLNSAFTKYSKGRLWVEFRCCELVFKVGLFVRSSTWKVIKNGKSTSSHNMLRLYFKISE